MNRILCAVCVASGFTALLLLALAGPAYQLELLELGQAFTLLRWAAYLGIASVPLILGYSFWKKPGGRVATVLAFSALAGLISAYIPISQMQSAKSVPPIHDISTDLDYPPEFVDILPLRKDAPNPPEYAGEETAELQREAYPNVEPLILDMPLERVYEAAQKTAENLNWHLVSATHEGDLARIEATDTTRWFGFKDDVVVRLQTLEQGTRVDVRSKSRVGQSDVGKNAERIREFSIRLQRTLAD